MDRWTEAEADTKGEKKSRDTDSLNLWESGPPASSLRTNDHRSTHTNPQNRNIVTSSSSSLPRQDSPSIFLPSLFNLSSDMFHSASKVAVKAAGRNRSQRGWQVILRAWWQFEVAFYFTPACLQLSYSIVVSLLSHYITLGLTLTRSRD